MEQYNYEDILRELKEARSIQNRLQEIIESIFDGVFITDSEANVIMVNRSYEEISGLNREDLLGKNMKDLVDRGLISRSVTLEILQTKKPITIDQEFRSGKRALVSGNPLFDEEGKITYVVTSVRDMTQIYRLQDKVTENENKSKEYRLRIQAMESQMPEDDGLVQASPRTVDVFTMAQSVARLDTTVLLLGETGTGKSELAKFIHQNSLRSKGNFVTINCSSIPENLMESELFGYEKGAFTGADREGRSGLFEVADRGTVFLDEIGEMSLGIQVKLLNVLQSGKITRVGGRKEIPIDVRVVTATNRDLRKLIADKKFREDLYYRINVFPIPLPPIRERQDDILPIADNYLESLNKRYNSRKTLTKGAREALTKYSWPGNIRELKNIVERAYIISPENLIQSSHLQLDARNVRPVIDMGGMDLKAYIEKEEMRIIEAYYKEYGSLRKAAKALGMDASTVVRKRQRYSKEKG